MSGEIKVLKVSPTTGADVIMGDSGDKFTFASGSEIDLTGVTKTGFPESGVTQMSQWQLQSDFTNTQTPVTNFLINSGDGYGTVGTAPTISSGVWTLPTTGFYLIALQVEIYDSSNSNAYAIAIETCTNGSSFNTATALRDHSPGLHAGGYRSIFGNFVFNCTDTSTHKVRINCDVSAATVSTRGSANENLTAVTFIRLA